MSGGLYNTHKADFDTTLDLTRLKAYGDTMNDGKVQFSFTLPVKNDEKGMEAARQLVRKMGVEEPNVALAKSLDKEFTFYVVYGSVVHTVDYENIHVQTVEAETMSMEETDEYIREHFGRKIVMIGASPGTDAQVPNEEFIKKAVEVNADVLLVSQTVTQKDIHIQNLTELIELLEAEGLRDRFIVCCGGARITHELAKELGFDAGFGASKYADDVATFAVTEMVKRGMK